MQPKSRTTVWAAATTVGAIAAALLAFRIAGFAGVGILGLLITFVAIRIDLEKDGAVGIRAPSMFAQQMAARESMSRAERAALDPDQAALKLPLRVAKFIGITLIAVGFGVFFFLRL